MPDSNLQNFLQDELSKREREGDQSQYSTHKMIVALQGLLYRQALMQEGRGEKPEVGQEELYRKFEDAARLAVEKFPEEGTAYLSLAFLLYSRDSDLRFLSWRDAPKPEDLENVRQPSDEVTALFDAVRRLLPNDPHAKSMVASNLETRGMTHEAEEIYESLLDDPEYCANAKWRLASIWLNQEKFDEAIATYRELLTLQPDQEQTHGDLIEAYRVAGRSDEMFAQMEATNTKFPNSSQVRSSMAHYHAHQGSSEEAMRIFQELANESRANLTKTLGG